MAGEFCPDGTLEHLGRIDHMVKIAGNRVELGDVETALQRLDGVGGAAASTYTDHNGHRRLIAAVVPVAGARLNSRLLRAELSRRLPGYMLPDRIIITEKLPQLGGGKVDRAAVAELHSEDDSASGEQTRPLSALERQLSAIWCEILEREEVGVDDDFFALGGDSLRAASLFAEIEAVCGIDRPMSLLAEASTIASLALALEDDSDWTSLLAVQPGGTRPPLFVIHDGGGNLLYARGLVDDLGPDQPIYGVRCEAMNGHPLRESTLTELASNYRARIQDMYPHGPYQLYGVSAGGIVAIEIARQLKDAGEEVPLVVLGDTPGPAELSSARSTLERGAGRLEELRSLGGAQRVRRSLWLAGRQLRHRGRLLRASLEDGARRLRGKPVPLDVRESFIMKQHGKLLAGSRNATPVSGPRPDAARCAGFRIA